MFSITSQEAGSRLLDALGEQLGALGRRYELVVVGGSALVALGLVSRPTKDVDVLAIREADRLETAAPLPMPLRTARDRVARDFGLPEEWLNDGPASLLDFGLPEGFLARAERRDHTPALTVWYASRVDQIHFKLYATVDQPASRHEADLRALRPDEQELLAAARWTRTHDPSDGYLDELLKALDALGVNGATLRS
jgi:hypothetical protein